jgi:hypothetical protein
LPKLSSWQLAISNWQLAVGKGLFAQTCLWCYKPFYLPLIYADQFSLRSYVRVLILCARFDLRVLILSCVF